MNIDEAKSAIRHAKAGWVVPEFLKCEIMAELCNIIFSPKNSARDRLHAIQTVLAAERLQIELKAAMPADPAAKNSFTLVSVELTADQWRICRETGIKPQELLKREADEWREYRERGIKPMQLLEEKARPLPPAPLSPQALLHGAA